MAKSQHGKRKVGESVDYTLPHGPHKGEIRSAIVTCVYESGSCSLSVFTAPGDELPPVWQIDNWQKEG